MENDYIYDSVFRLWMDHILEIYDSIEKKETENVLPDYRLRLDCYHEDTRDEIFKAMTTIQEKLVYLYGVQELNKKRRES